MDEKTLELLAEFMRTVLARVAENEAHIRDTLVAEMKVMVAAIPAPAAGKDGVGIVRATVTDRRLLLTMSDGTVQDAGPVVPEAIPGPAGKDGAPGRDGKDGAPGKDGVGIVKVAIADRHLYLATTAGDEIDAGVVVPEPVPGPKGEKGDPGTPGPIGAQGEKGMPGMAGPAGIAGAPGRDGVDGKDGAPGMNGKDGAPGRDGKDGAPGINGKDGRGIDDMSINDGILTVKFTDGAKIPLGRVVGERGPEGVPGVPGQSIVGPKGEKGDPARDGAPGAKGDPGKDGKDGKDGISKEQLEEGIVRGTEAVIASMSVEGSVLKIGDRSYKLPIPEYKQVWRDGVTYEPGDFVTLAGSVWHCNVKTARRPGIAGDTSGEWTLAVKAGKDAPRPVDVRR